MSSRPASREGAPLGAPVAVPRAAAEASTPARAPEAGRGPARTWRRREAVLLAFLLAFSIGTFLWFTRLDPFGESSTAQNVALFLLININIVLSLLALFLLGQNLVRMLLERRRRVLGSHLRVRLVAAFVAVAITPAVLLFVVARGFVDSSMESWFSVRVEGALESALDMAETYYREQEARGLGDARFLAASLGLRARIPGVEDKVLDRERVRLRASAVTVLGASGEVLGRAVENGLPVGAAEPPEGGLLELAGRDGGASTRASIGDAELLRTIAPIAGPAGTVRGFVVVDRALPAAVARRRAEIEQSHREYRQLRLLRRPLTSSYELALFFVSVAVVVGGVWLGIVIARSLADPVQRLVEGTRRVGEGHLDERIHASTGSEEIALLIDGFNQMTERLGEARSTLTERTGALEAILANIAGGVISIDKQARIEIVNPAARQLLGIDEGAIGMVFRDWLTRPALAVVRDLLTELDRRAQEGLHDGLPPRRVSVTRDDGVAELVATGVVLRDDAGGAIGALLFFEDVTEILSVQRMEAWREIARRIAHDIKNPRTPIQLSAQRLRKRYAAELGGIVLDECTHTIIEEVEVLKNLVAEFATFARLPSGPRVPTDLGELVREAMVLFRESSPAVEFALDAGRVPALEIDTAAIRRVLTNLLTNAVEAIAERSRATGVRAAAGGSEGPAAEEPALHGHVWLRTEYDPARALVRLEVADDGIGLTPEARARLFEPYFSTKAQGTGLGLAIVSATLADHRAFIRVRENPPRGTRFLIEFPVRETDPAC